MHAVSTTFTPTERAYQEAVEEAFARYGRVVARLKSTTISTEARRAELLAKAREDYGNRVRSLRLQFGVDDSGRERPAIARTEAESKLYAPAHGGYPGSVVVR